ncbi:DUF4383 domain-containing protein [Nonomuraea typhae]|uniref:DUF4383 domain-containing protein n=1 Tax=Nonomuraea typhae TaxID=2603600 RepID=UPI0012FAF218|nr:DUF4383 domain-containing protein [Nonomuraea typhae]
MDLSRSPIQLSSMVIGVLFLLVGVLGFIPGITTGLDGITFAGHQSDAMLLGVFEVSILHNVVHLAFGLAGILLARTWQGARGFLVGGGVIYLLLGVYGLLITHDSALNFVPVNRADNWLHLGLALVMVLLGVVLGRRQPVTS